MAITITNPLYLDLTREFLAENFFAPLVAGDTVVWRFQVRDEADAAVNLTGCTITFRIFETDAATTNIISRAGVLDGSQGTEVGDTGKGWWSVTFLPADQTVLLAASGRKFYQAVVTFGDASVRTFIQGRIDILRKH